MRKINTLGLGILIAVMVTVLAVSVTLALPSNRGVDTAREKNPAPFPQPPEKELTKIVFIRFAPGKEPMCDDDGICEPKENWKNCPKDCPKGGEEEPPATTCYGFLSGAQPKWNWLEDYYYGDNSLEKSSLQAVVATWEEATSGDIFGEALTGSYDWGKYDYKNAISFGDYKDPNVIAVTAIWFRGKNIYEYDIMFDTDYFLNGKEGNYDLETVTLHEFGHGAGLDDLYDIECKGNVMYGYYVGEKTELGSGDIIGIQTLYGVK